MADDFQTALKAGNWLEAFSVAINDAVNLEVVTIIEETDSSLPQETRVIRASDLGKTVKTGEVLYTRLNEVQGDIVNVVGAKFTSDPYKELQQFHKEQVSKGEDIIKRNVEIVKEIIEYAIKLKNQSPQLPQTPPAPPSAP